MSGADPDNHITEKLLAFAKALPPSLLFPTVVPEAAAFVAKNPYAFTLAICLDRGTRAEIIWTIPYDINASIGHLDPLKLRKLSIGDLSALISKLPRKPRYTHDAPRTIQSLTQVVLDQFGGDATRIWTGRLASEVKSTFQSVYGVGEGISNMAVLLIEKAFGIRFSDRDHRTMDIKPDVHTMRVLTRLSAAAFRSEKEAIAAARRLHPSYPGELDPPLWYIGQQWCRPTKPDCVRCPLTSVCPKVDVGSLGDGGTVA